MNRLFVFILFALVVSAATTFCVPSPEQYAAATATVYRAQGLATANAHYNTSLEQANYARQTASAGEAYATATAVAMSAQATATAVAVSASSTAAAARVAQWGTATAVANSALATSTAVPIALGVTASTAARDKTWGWIALGGDVLLILTLFAIATAVVSWVRTRARIVPRDASGQLPALWDERTQTLADPSRMIGPAITLPHQPDALVLVARAIHYLETGQVQPLARERVETTDGGADADHLLAAARASLAATATAAMFRPDNIARGRGDKLEMIRSGVLALPMGGDASASTPQTRVIVAGDSAIQAIARQLGDNIPALGGGTGEQVIDNAPAHHKDNDDET
jgi:hypothetical protein